MEFLYSQYVIWNYGNIGAQRSQSADRVLSGLGYALTPLDQEVAKGARSSEPDLQGLVSPFHRYDLCCCRE
jgi:hypothetical protein